MISMVDVVRAVEGIPCGSVSGCEAEDVRDALVHLRWRVANLEGIARWRDAPNWTVLDQYAIEVMVKCLKALGNEAELWVIGKFLGYMEDKLKHLRLEKNRSAWRRDDVVAVDVLLRMLGAILVQR